MSNFVHLTLSPLGQRIEVSRGSLLGDVLFARGVEFPCGGQGRCRGCKIRVLAGVQPPTPEDLQKFSAAELAQGWRLACRTRAQEDMVIELAQWEAPILADDSVFPFTPAQGYGIAVDLGTTTLAAQLVDLRTGAVKAVRTGLNPQARYGADIMSRIDFALRGEQLLLTQVIRQRIGELIAELLAEASVPPGQLARVCLVGNTVMHHLFCGIDVEPLSRVPFESNQSGLQLLSVQALGWPCAGDAPIYFLPCLGSFVGSDILAGVLATGLHQGDKLAALVDLGTNGEIVVGTAQRMLCASTAAGPAFEGARISMGMRATTGAIAKVRVRDGRFECQVLGNGEPLGLCGSGLVDAVAGSLELGLIKPSGRLVHGESIALAPPVQLTQRDIRELQYAKGAIAAGIRILVKQWGASLEDVTQVFLAGAFGNYIDHANAGRIGLLPFAPDKVKAVGNTALLGAKLALFNQPTALEYRAARGKIQHVSLNEDLEFQNVYAEEMGF